MIVEFHCKAVHGYDDTNHEDDGEDDDDDDDDKDKDADGSDYDNDNGNEDDDCDLGLNIVKGFSSGVSSLFRVPLLVSEQLSTKKLI